MDIAASNRLLNVLALVSKEHLEVECHESPFGTEGEVGVLPQGLRLDTGIGGVGGREDGVVEEGQIETLSRVAHRSANLP